jgi:hypothetical protein
MQSPSQADFSLSMRSINTHESRPLRVGSVVGAPDLIALSMLVGPDPYHWLNDYARAIPITVAFFHARD